LIRRIPTAARHFIAEALIKILEECVKKSDVPSLIDWLLTFAYTSFSMPDLTDKREVSLATIVKENLIRTTDPPSLCENKATKRPGFTMRKAVERKMLRRQYQWRSTESVIRRLRCAHAEVLGILRSKHPKGIWMLSTLLLQMTIPFSNLSRLRESF
jgi:hypothetical protein